MTLSAALRVLRDAGALDAEPGPVRAALAWLAPLDLDAPVWDGNPMLCGALLCLLRHVTNEPYAHVLPPDGGYTPDHWYVLLPREGSWATDLGAPTELDAVIAALVAEAEVRIPRWVETPLSWTLSTPRIHFAVVLPHDRAWVARVWTTEPGREFVDSPPLPLAEAKAWAERTVAAVREAGELPVACAWPPLGRG